MKIILHSAYLRQIIFNHVYQLNLREVNSDDKMIGEGNKERRRRVMKGVELFNSSLYHFIIFNIPLKEFKEQFDANSQYLIKSSVLLDAALSRGRDDIILHMIKSIPDKIELSPDKTSPATNSVIVYKEMINSKMIVNRRDFYYQRRCLWNAINKNNLQLLTTVYKTMSKTLCKAKPPLIKRPTDQTTNDFKLLFSHDDDDDNQNINNNKKDKKNKKIKKIKNSKVEIIKYIKSNKLFGNGEWFQIMSMAITCGAYQVVEYINKHCKMEQQPIIDHVLVDQCAKNKSSKTLEMMYDVFHCMATRESYINAVNHGSLDCIKYLAEKQPFVECPANLLDTALVNGDMKIVDYLLTTDKQPVQKWSMGWIHNSIISIDLIERLSKHPMVQFKSSFLLTCAIQSNESTLLEYAKAQNKRFEYNYDLALEKSLLLNNREMIQWIPYNFKGGFALSYLTLDAIKDDLEILEILKDIPTRLTWVQVFHLLEEKRVKTVMMFLPLKTTRVSGDIHNRLADRAASLGSVELFTLIINMVGRSQTFDERTLDKACKGKSMDIVKYVLGAINKPLPNYQALPAIEVGALDIVKYLDMLKLEWPKPVGDPHIKPYQLVETAIRGNQPEMLDYLMSLHPDALTHECIQIAVEINGKGMMEHIMKNYPTSLIRKTMVQLFNGAAQNNHYELMNKMHKHSKFGNRSFLLSFGIDNISNILVEDENRQIFISVIDSEHFELNLDDIAEVQKYSESYGSFELIKKTCYKYLDEHEINPFY